MCAPYRNDKELCVNLLNETGKVSDSYLGTRVLITSGR